MRQIGEDGQTLHASCVAVGGKGVLILGASGAGKSALALQLMAYGATLVSDDQTILTLCDGHPFGQAPETIRGKIEARGVGILSAGHAGPVPLSLVVDMDRLEEARLPPMRKIYVAGAALSLLHKVENAHFPASVLQYLKGGRTA